MRVHAVSALINGSWRIYRCESIADVEALEDVFAKQGIEHKYLTVVSQGSTWN